MNVTTRAGVRTFPIVNGIANGSYVNTRPADRNKEQIIHKRKLLQSRLISTSGLAEMAFRRLAGKQGFSFIRLGDSELLILAQDLVFPSRIPISRWGVLLADLCREPNLGEGDDEVRRWEHIVKVSGNQFPDIRARDYLMKAISAASVIGIPTTYRPGRSVEHIKLLEGFQTLFINIMQRLSINPVRIADSAEHHFLHASGWFRRLLLPDQYSGLCQRFSLPLEYRPAILLIGNLAAPFGQILLKEGCKLAGCIQPVGFYNIEEVVSETYQYSYDLALVSAGTAAKYICTCLATQMGKVALDTGQLFDVLLTVYGHLNYDYYNVPYMTFM